MINPDTQAVEGIGAINPYLTPSPGALRFVERGIEEHGVPKRVRILQVYEWSFTLKRHDWFDVPMGVEEDERAASDEEGLQA